ncbi:MAG: acyl-CoA dehydrogenase family protein [Bdellovibrionales bacterium]|nr:acyl-CoA dehydrogenase family protein [Bdellovibrionales bacterium]
MSLFFNDTHLALKESVRRFAETELKPRAAELDESEGFNLEALRKMGALGLLGITADPNHGGSGLDVVAATLVMEEFGAVCASSALSYLAHSILAVNNLSQNGSEAQKAKYLPRLCSGEWIGSMAMSEPGAGSDAFGMSTQAVRKGDKYILNGTKLWITNASHSNFFWVYAKTGPTKKDITTFIVERDFPGFSVSKKLHKLGMRASPTCELIFNNCEVPVANRVGEEASSIVHMNRNLLVERVTISGISLGISRAAIAYATQYAMDRKQFNKPLMDFQMIQKMLADSTAEYLAGRSLTYEAAATIDRLGAHSNEALMLGTSAKLFTAPHATKAALDAIQILGGYGYTKEYPVERYMRDAKLMEIGAGTNEVMRIILARELERGHIPGV